MKEIDMQSLENIYHTLLGEMTITERVSGIENAFTPGSVCDNAYREMLDAYARLRERLGAGDEDGDVETIINAMLEMQHDLCVKMFRLGSQYQG